MIVMIAFLSIALFTTVSAATIADAESARVDYSNCLVDFTTAQLDMKTGTAAFKKAAKSACADERNAMISAMEKDEISPEKMYFCYLPKLTLHCTVIKILILLRFLLLFLDCFDIITSI